MLRGIQWDEKLIKLWIIDHEAGHEGKDDDHSAHGKSVDGAAHNHEGHNHEGHNHEGHNHEGHNHEGHTHDHNHGN